MAAEVTLQRLRGSIAVVRGEAQASMPRFKRAPIEAGSAK